MSGLGGLFSGVASAFSSIGGYNAAKSNARWTAAEGELKAFNRAKQIVQLGAAQKNAYVGAGLELEGTPQAVMQDTYNTGLEDITAIQSGYQKQIKNQMTQARARLLGGLLGSAAKIGSSLYGLGIGSDNLGS